MDKAGGIIALIAGVLGIVAGFFTLFVGGLGSAFEAKGADGILNLAWAGLALSMLAVIGGGISLARPRPGGMTVVFASVIGIVYGGSLVALCLALALIGGALAVLAPTRTGEGESPEPGRKRLQALALSLFAGLAVVVTAVLIEQRGNASDERTGMATAPETLPQATLGIGQTATGEKFAVTLRDFALRPSVGLGANSRLAPPGSVYAVLDTAVKCVDRESRRYHPGAVLARINGRIVKFDSHENLAITRSFGMINPLTEERSLLVYTLPAEAANAELVWQPGDGAGQSAFLLHSPAVSALPAPPATTAQSSTGAEIYRRDGSTLEFAQLTTGEVSFKLLVVSHDGNTGEAEGVVQPRDGMAVWKNEVFGCELKFHWQGNALRLEQKGGCGFGMGVDGSGVYVR